MSLNLMTAEANIRENFWELPLEKLNKQEWELLCDGCGRCCLKKLQDYESKDLLWTRIACRYLDQTSCRCASYDNRATLVRSCLNVRQMYRSNRHWMPTTCAYRLRAENKTLFSWHPLLAGSNEAMVAAGISVLGRILSEEHVHPDGYEEHVITWVDS